MFLPLLSAGCNLFGALIAPFFFFFLIRARVALVLVSLGALWHLFISSKSLCFSGFTYLGPLLLLFNLDWSPCCSGFILFGVLVASVCFELEPLLLWFFS